MTVRRVAIVGKPNVGKSSIDQQVWSEKHRVIVSDIAGTTRDAIDTEVKCTMEKSMYLLIQQDFAARIRSKRNWSATVLSVR